MSRRSLIASVSAAAAAAMFSSALRAGDAPRGAPGDATSPPRRLRKAVMLGMIAAPGEGASVVDRFKLARDAGFDGVEIDSPTDTPMAEIQAAAEKTGLIPHGVVHSRHWQFPLNSPEPAVRDKCRDALETALRDAKAVGASSVLLVPAVVNRDMPYADAWKLSQDEIRRVIPLAAELKIKIAIENVWNNFLQSPLEAARYVDEFRSEWVAFHFDIGNVINYGWPAHWISALGARIVKLHIKDYSRKKRDDEGLWKGFGVELGEGDADWPATMKALDAVGYTAAVLGDGGGNWATAEVRGGDGARLTKIREQMERVLSA